MKKIWQKGFRRATAGCVTVAVGVSEGLSPEDTNTLAALEQVGVQAVRGCIL